MALTEGVNMRITVGGKEIMHEISADLSAQTDFKEVATKDTNGKLVSPGAQTWGIAIEAMLDYDGTTQEDAYTMSEAWNAKTLVSVTLTTGTSGDAIYSGSAYIADFSTSAKNEEYVSYSFNFKGSGDLTIAKVV